MPSKQIRKGCIELKANSKEGEQFRALLLDVCRQNRLEPDEKELREIVRWSSRLVLMLADFAEQAPQFVIDRMRLYIDIVALMLDLCQAILLYSRDYPAKDNDECVAKNE